MQPGFPRRGQASGQQQPHIQPGNWIKSQGLPGYNRTVHPTRGPNEAHNYEHRGSRIIHGPPNCVPFGPSHSPIRDRLYNDESSHIRGIPQEGKNISQHGIGSSLSRPPHHGTSIFPAGGNQDNRVNVGTVKNVQQIPSLMESQDRPGLRPKPPRSRWDQDCRPPASPVTNVKKIPALIGHRTVTNITPTMPTSGHLVEATQGDVRQNFVKSVGTGRRVGEAEIRYEHVEKSGNQPVECIGHTGKHSENLETVSRQEWTPHSTGMSHVRGGLGEAVRSLSVRSLEPTKNASVRAVNSDEKQHSTGSQLVESPETRQSSRKSYGPVISGGSEELSKHRYAKDRLSNSTRTKSTSNFHDQGERRSNFRERRDRPRSKSKDRSSSDRRDVRSGSPGRSYKSSSSGIRRDRQLSSRGTGDNYSSDSRSLSSGSRRNRRDRRSVSPEKKSRMDQRSSSRDPRERRSRYSQKVHSQQDRSMTRGDCSPPRRKRSRSPVGERSKKRSRNAGSSREDSLSREAAPRERGDSDRCLRDKGAERRERTPMNVEELDEVGEANAKWDRIERELEEDKAADALLASFMSGDDKEIEPDGEDVTPRWIQSSGRENYYTSNPTEITEGSTLAGTPKLKNLLEKFQTSILDIYTRAKAEQPKFEITFKESDHHHHNCDHSDEWSSDSTSSESGESDEEPEETTEAISVMRQKEKHPARLGKNLWFNDKGHLNDRPICRCSLRARKSGIRHNIFPGEQPYPRCDPHNNNLKKLHHYTIQIVPCTNFVFRFPTVITYDQDDFIFEGLSLFSHVPLDDIPPCTVIRFSIEYTLTLVKAPVPENFTIQELDHFSDYVFREILELYDFDYSDQTGEGCRRFHFMPRFARLLPNNGKEILSMHRVMLYLVNMRRPVMTEEQLGDMLKLGGIKWSRFLSFMNNMIVSAPGKKPSSVRVDQVDRDLAVCTEEKKVFPVIVHAGVMPLQLSYTANPKYKKLYRSFLRMRHLFLNRSRVSEEEQQDFIKIQDEMAEIRRSTFVGKEVTAELDCSTMTITGIRSDVCQHVLILPVLVNYIRYHMCLDKLNEKLGNIFTDKVLLKRAMTHPSYRLTFGMNSDHIRNSLYNCGLRSPEFGKKNWQRSSENRKKGIINLVKIMSRLAEEEEVSSNIHHYERLEFLGDAVVEFITSTALYHLFPNLEEGGLAMYRQALVENQHLGKVAKKLDLQHFMLYSHGPDLCRNKDLEHAVANCFEALIGAIYMECGIDEAKRVFCNAVFEDEDLQLIWAGHPKHPLQQQVPEGDRHMIEEFPILKKMTEFEERTGMTFKHIRLLARAFTQRTMTYNDLTLGHNQRMEFLGDSVLQLIVSAYLFRHFPEHHEGHLSLLRSSLVNNTTQSIICQDLGLEDFIIEANVARASKRPVSTKLQADLLEALIGAMYVDSGLDVVEAFCNVCFFPRLREFIIRQDWNDDKSKLQQVVLTLRREGAAHPDVPYYKLLKKSGPTNSSVFTVAVFFKNRRIGQGSANSVRAAEKAAARDALRNGQYEQIKFQSKLMSSLYPEEFKPPQAHSSSGRPRKLPIPKQYAEPDLQNRRDKQ